MKYIYGERCSGKTMAEMEGYADITQRIISYEDYLESKRIGAIRDKKIIIDEAGSLLREIFGENLAGYSEILETFL